MSPPLPLKRPPGVLQGTVLAGILAALCAGWAIDRAQVRGDFGGEARGVACGDLSSAELEGRLRIEGCALHLPSASVVLDGPAVVGGYARLQPVDGPSDAMPVLVRVSEPGRVDLLGQALQAQSLGDPDAWVKTRLVALVPRVDLEGVVLRGRHLDGTDRDHLQLHAGALTADAGVFAHPATLPSPWPPAGLGLLLGILALWGWLRPPSGITTGLGTGAPRKM